MMTFEKDGIYEFNGEVLSYRYQEGDYYVFVNTRTGLFRGYTAEELGI